MRLGSTGTASKVHRRGHVKRKFVPEIGQEKVEFAADRAHGLVHRRGNEKAGPLGPFL